MQTILFVIDKLQSNSNRFNFIVYNLFHFLALLFF